MADEAVQRFVRPLHWLAVLRQILESKALCLVRWTLLRLTFPEICPMNTTRFGNLAEPGEDHEPCPELGYPWRLKPLPSPM